MHHHYHLAYHLRRERGREEKKEGGRRKASAASLNLERGLDSSPAQSIWHLLSAAQIALISSRLFPPRVYTKGGGKEVTNALSPKGASRR